MRDTQLKKQTIVCSFPKDCLRSIKILQKPLPHFERNTLWLACGSEFGVFCFAENSMAQTYSVFAGHVGPICIIIWACTFWCAANHANLVIQCHPLILGSIFRGDPSCPGDDAYEQRLKPNQPWDPGTWKPGCPWKNSGIQLQVDFPNISKPYSNWM